MYFYDDGLKIMKDGKEGVVSRSCEFEFSLRKYLERIGEENPDIVSVLFASNELQSSTYETLYDDVEELVSNIKRLIKEIKRAGRNIRVIINLPPNGSDQYAWGLVKGCSATSKRYNFAIKLACERLIDEFDNHKPEGIYMSDGGGM